MAMLACARGCSLNNVPILRHVKLGQPASVRRTKKGGQGAIVCGSAKVVFKGPDIVYVKPYTSMTTPRGCIGVYASRHNAALPHAKGANLYPLAYCDGPQWTQTTRRSKPSKSFVPCDAVFAWPTCRDCHRQLHFDDSYKVCKQPTIFQKNRDALCDGRCNKTKKKRIRRSSAQYRQLLEQTAFAGVALKDLDTDTQRALMRLIHD